MDFLSLIRKCLLKQAECCICSTSLQNSGSYSCTHHPIPKPVFPPENADLEIQLCAPVMCMSCLRSSLSYRLKNKLDLTICPFLDPKEGKICSFTVADDLLVCLSDVSDDIQIVEAKESPSLSLVHDPLAKNKSVSLAVRLAQLRHNLSQYLIVQQDPSSGTSLQRFFTIMCRNCEYLNLLDRSVSETGLPLGHSCVYCQTWICTGCEDTVGYPFPATRDRSRSRSPSPSKSKSKSRSISRETDRSQNAWLNHMKHKSFRHTPYQPWNTILLGIQGRWANTHNHSLWSKAEIRYRSMFLRACMEKERSQCPRCFQSVLKDDGCTHVSCSSCHCTFCFCCGGLLFATVSDYLQFTNGSEGQKRLTAGLFIVDKETPTRIQRFNRVDLSSENLKTYSMDLHHIPFNQSLSNSKFEDSYMFFSDSSYDRSCPKMLEYLPSYLEHKAPHLFQIMQPVLDKKEWEKTEHFQMTSADRYTGPFEVTKMILSLDNARHEIGSPIFNSGIHYLKKEVSQFDSKEFFKAWGYIPTAAQLFLMQQALAYFPVF